MKIGKTLGGLAFGLLASVLVAMPGGALAENLTMWVRDSGATLTTRVIDHWNKAHPEDKIDLTVIPHDQMVTKFATAAAAGEGPDILSLDLIFMPDFMKAGFMTDITDLTDDPQLEVYAKTGNLPSRIDLAKNKYFDADPRLGLTAEALAIAQTPWTFHFNDMSNDNSSPWIEMLQTAVFGGDIDGAITKAKKRMYEIQLE